MSENIYLDRINELLSEGKHIRDKEELGTYRKGKGILWRWSLFQKLYYWEASSINVITQLLGKNTYYYERFPRFQFPSEENKKQPDFEIKLNMNLALGILDSLKIDLTRGLLHTPAIIVSKDILQNILLEAKALINAGYSAASCIYTRVYIETLIKKIADIKNIGYNKDVKVNMLCNLLKEEEIIPLPDWRQLLAWIDLGNEAAHGNFDNCTPQRISQIINELYDFEQKYLKRN